MSYSTMPTYRRGRTYYREKGDRGGLGGFCSVLGILVLLLVPPSLVLVSEFTYRNRIVALTELLDRDITPLSASSKPRDIVHGTADNRSNPHGVRATDSASGVSVSGAFKLRRNTEYCQWREMRSEKCDKCTRQVKARDGSEETETYDCHCITEYHYVKSWNRHRINSMIFDQPAAHHNPQRDPLPSSTFLADHPVLDVHGGGREWEGLHGSGRPVRTEIGSDMLQNIRAAWRRMEWVPGGIPPPPGFFSRWFGGNGYNKRHAPMSDLAGVDRSLAAVRDHFVYVGQGGYFYSPYATSNSERLMKYFFQYMEGSLLDWQLGDLMPSCTAGDIRVSYEVQDPIEVSLLGQVTSPAKKERGGTVKINSYVAENEMKLGLFHSGHSGPYEMIRAEEIDAKKRTIFTRLLLLVWSYFACRLLGAFLGYDVSNSTVAPWASAVLGVWLSAMGLTWTCCWGVTSRDSALALAVGACLLSLFVKLAPRTRAPPGFNATWCMVGRWANVPPEWRVEDSYRAEPHGVNAGPRKTSKQI